MPPPPHGADMILLRGLDHRIYRAATPPFRETCFPGAAGPSCPMESLEFGVCMEDGGTVRVLISRHADGTFTAGIAGWAANTFCAYGAAQSWVMHHVMRLPPEPAEPARALWQEGWIELDPACGRESIRAAMRHNRKLEAARQAVQEAVDRVLNLRPVPGDAEAIRHARYLRVPWAAMKRLEEAA